MKKQCGVYQLVNIITGESYIGSSRDLTERKCQHFSDLRHKRHWSPRLQQDFNKYGERSFQFEILSNCDPRELIIEEQAFVDKSPFPIYNIRINNVASPQGCHHTEETKRRMSESKIRRPVSQETREKLRACQTGILNSIETNQKISQTMMGHLVSQETREKMSNSAKSRRKK